MGDRGADAQAATDPSLAQRIVEEEACADAEKASKTPQAQATEAAAQGEPWEEEAASCAVGVSTENPLREALLSVGWTFPVDQAVSQGQPDYLDGSCLIYAEERLLDVVDFRGAHSSAVGCHGQKASSANYEWSAGRGKAAAVLHSGDVMSAEGGQHVIRVRLADLPACATDCFFAISAYNCRNLSLFRSLNVRLLDADFPTRPLAKLKEDDIPARSSAIVVGSLNRRLDEWRVHGISQACEATVRDYTPVEAVIRPLQESHVRWRRRGPLVLLSALLQHGRAVPIERMSGHEEEERDLIVQVMKLPSILFQQIVHFI